MCLFRPGQMPDSGHIGSGSRSPDAWLAYCLSLSLPLYLSQLGLLFRYWQQSQSTLPAANFQLPLSKLGNNDDNDDDDNNNKDDGKWENGKDASATHSTFTFTFAFISISLGSCFHFGFTFDLTAIPSFVSVCLFSRRLRLRFYARQGKRHTNIYAARRQCECQKFDSPFTNE